MSFVVIQPRRGTAASAAASNPILAVGERGYELPPTVGAYGRWKTGDGVTHWNDLPYDNDPQLVVQDAGAWREALGAAANSAATITTTSEASNSLNVTQTSAATLALRLEQQGTGMVGKWRTGGADRGFITNEGHLRLLPADDGRGVMVEGLDWTASRALGFGNKDYVFGVTDFTDRSGLPMSNGVFSSYSKIFGATATKYGPGNMDAFWATMHHYGPDEIGLCIGDANTHNGGNAWGFDFRAYSDTVDASLFGGVIGVKPGSQRTITVNGVTGTSLASTTFAASAAVSATTISCVANPGTGRFSLGSGATLEYVSIASVTGSGPYTATLTTPTVYAHSSGAAITIYQTQVIGLHIMNEANNPADIGLWVNSPGGANGDFAEMARFTNAAGTTVFQLSPAGLVKAGHVQPISNGNYDLGTVSARYRALYVNSIAINGANMAGSAGSFGIKNAAAVPTSIPTDGTVLYGDTGRLMATGGIGAWTNTDGAIVVRLQTDRPWNFKQIGTAGSTALRLVPDATDKIFDIASPAGNKVIEMLVSDTAASSVLGLMPSSAGKLGFFGATAVARPSAYTQTYAAADKTLAAYTANAQNVAYTGSPADAASTAKLTDLNALRVAYENLRAFTEDLAQHHNAVLDDLQLLGLLQ